MDRLEIGVVTPFYAPSFASGGVTRVVHETSKELSQRGHSVTVLTSDVLHQGDTDEIGRVPLQDLPVHIDGCRVFYFRHILSSLQQHSGLLLTPEMYKYMPRVLQNLDVIHIHDHRTPLCAYAGRIAQKVGVPYLISPHGSLTRDSGRSILKYIFDKLAGDRLLEESDKIIALTDEEVDDTRAAGLSPHKIDIVRNGVSIPPREEDREEHRFKELEFPNSAFLILYLGRLHDRKRIGLLIRAVSKVSLKRDVHLVIVGRDDGAKKRLIALTKKLQVEDRVHFLGTVSEELKRACYENSDVFALTSWGEGLPMSVLEAGSYGLPLVLTEGTNFREAEENNAGIIVESDVPSIQKAFEYYARNPDIHRLHSENSRELVRDYFSLSSQVSTLENIYADTVRQGAP